MIIIIGVIGSTMEDDDVPEQETEEIVTEQDEVDETENETDGEIDEPVEEPIDLTIEVNEELKFDLFDIELDTVEVYEEDEKILADIRMHYMNRNHEYDTTSLFVATLFNVKQGGESLTEVNDAWNPENRNSSDAFFPNAAGGEIRVDFTYQLVDETTPLEIEFYPTTETEGTETVTIDLIE